MSDDERMDRAKRIRELREGRRGGADSDEGTDAETRNEPDESQESVPDESDSNAPDGDGNQETAPSGDQNGLSGQDAAGEQETPAPESEPALAAAAAARQAASEFEGEIDGTDDVAQATGQPVSAETATEEAEPAQAASGPAETADTETNAETTRVLEFRLGEELYCLDIEYVEEIVREGDVTRVPNTPEYVSGVVDLRGQITTILDPKVTIGMDNDEADQLMLVFDAETFEDHGYIGWLVDEVNQVRPITDDDVKESPIQESYINGIIERDDEFIIWTTPELALDVDEA